MNKFACAALAAASAIAVSIGAFAEEPLRKDQEELLAMMMDQIDPAMRDQVRPQMRASVAAMNEQQVAMVKQGMVEQKAAQNEAPEPEPDEEPKTASPQDLAYNKAQYEPVIRANWAAQKAFDDHVDAAIEKQCPTRDSVSVYGAGFSYEIYPLPVNWIRGSDSADNAVAVLGASYAPQDGRYKFDFSDVRTSHDKAKVDAAIATACAEYKRVGAEWKAAAQAKVDADDHDGAYKLQGSGFGKLEKVAAPLNEVLAAEAPNGNYALYTALQNGERID